MKLEDAIRAGSKKTTQHYGWFRDDDLTATCALGAALLAVNGPDAQMTYYAVYETFPETVASVGYYPPGSEVPAADLADLIAWANDQGATREEIADWIQWLREGGAL